MPIWKKQVRNYTGHTTTKLNKKEWQYLINYPKHLDISGFVYWKPLNRQALRFMVGPGHCPMISKYGPSLSKAVGPVDPSFLVVKKSTLIKIFILQ